MGQQIERKGRIWEKEAYTIEYKEEENERKRLTNKDDIREKG
jgi:hypothetical protein